MTLTLIVIPFYTTQANNGLDKVMENIEEGAGNSGKVPKGLTTAPGIQKKIPPADITPPFINITEVFSDASSTDIYWTTDEEASSTLHYGTSTTMLDSSIDAVGVASSSLYLFDVSLTDLPASTTASTTYYFVIEATDIIGNSTSTPLQSFVIGSSSTSPQYPNIPTSYSSPTYTKYYPSLSYVGEITGLNNPAGVAVRNDGVIFVADYHNDQVKMYDQSFNIIKTIGSTRGSAPGQFSEPWDIAFDSNSNAYITDTNNSRVQVFDTDGDFVRQFAAPGSAQGIAINSGDYVYVSGRDVEVFDVFGNSFGKIPVSADSYPRNIAIDDQDGVHFSNYGNVSLAPGEDFYRYDERNTLTLNYPNGEEILERNLDFQPLFIDVDDLNRVWVTDHTNGQVQVYDYSEDRLIQSSFVVSSSTHLTTENPKGLEIHGNYLYVTSDVTDDVKIYEITNELATTTDTEAPVFQSVSVSEFSGGAYIEVDAVDEDSELQSANVWLRNEAADWNIFHGLGIVTSSHSRAEISNAFPVSGTWKIQRIRTYDVFGNMGEYNYGTDYNAEIVIP